jgi:hypothetical protein
MPMGYANVQRKSKRTEEQQDSKETKQQLAARECMSSVTKESGFVVVETLQRHTRNVLPVSLNASNYK